MLLLPLVTTRFLFNKVLQSNDGSRRTWKKTQNKTSHCVAPFPSSFHPWCLAVPASFYPFQCIFHNKVHTLLLTLLLSFEMQLVPVCFMLGITSFLVVFNCSNCITHSRKLLLSSCSSTTHSHLLILSLFLVSAQPKPNADMVDFNHYTKHFYHSVSRLSSSILRCNFS